MTDGSEGVIDPEKLPGLVRVPVTDQFARCPRFDRDAAPVVRGGEREHMRDGRLSHGRLAEEEHEPVLAQGLGCLSVWLRDHERGYHVASGYQKGRRLGVGALVQDL